jgi:hypothetical protein
MKMKILIGIISSVVILLFSWQFFRGDKIKTVYMEQYEKTTGIVNSVYASGRSYKRSTLINVSYTYSERQRRANLRREGYKEGTFNKGDTIIIYVNRDNPDEIK